jgi:hypothetical protein
VVLIGEEALNQASVVEEEVARITKKVTTSDIMIDI